MLQDLGMRCSVDTARSAKTAAQRATHEGDAFFLITLPAFGKDFEKSLADGFASRELFRGFEKTSISVFFTEEELSKRNLPEQPSGIPKFLGEFLGRVFDPFTGLLRTDGPFDKESTADAVHAVRQLTLAFGKVRLDCTDEQNKAALDAYVRTDAEITTVLEELCAQPNFWVEYVEPLKAAVRVLFGDVLCRMESLIHDYDLVPKHGPGATADRLLGNAKYHQLEWTERMESLFPFGEYAIPNHRYHAEIAPQVVYRSPERERPVRVVLVPKTVVTPRVIAIEPTCMQYMQQAVAIPLVELLESPSIVKGRENISSWFLGFTDQAPNQHLAQIGSEDQSLATLDLSEASDRVPNWLVEAMFEDWPWFSEAVQVTRSLRADVPGHGVLPVLKFASMGSALTFPVEAMVFLAIAMLGVAKADDRSVTQGYLNRLKDRVRVYGDDIIVPNHSAELVVRSLETYGFKVNRRKSFWTGKFRESCGKEYYEGLDVSIVRYRSEIPSRQALKRDDDATYATQVVSTVSTRNQFYNAGMWTTAAALDEVLEWALNGFYPYVEEESSLLGRNSSFLSEVETGWDEDLQVPLVKGYVTRSKLPRNVAADYAALLKCLHVANGEANTDIEHLTKSGRPRAVGIKLSKAQPI
jgi:hypothetical protein